jgi:hypothetical protein
MFLALTSRRKFSQPLRRLSPLVSTKRSHGHRVEPEEIGRRHHVQPVAQPEGRAATFLVGQARRFEKHVLKAVREGDVPLLDDVPGCRIGPDRIGKTGIVRIRPNHIGGRHAHRPAHDVRLQASRSPDSALAARISSCGCIIHAICALSNEVVTPNGSIFADRHASRFERTQGADIDAIVADEVLLGMLTNSLIITCFLYHRPRIVFGREPSPLIAQHSALFTSLRVGVA